ncbi:hypothetical protein EDB81DRAFT_661509, partial [Dactylonectria macrodidyma]
PWRSDSMYAEILSAFTDAENDFPIHHRYDSVKFVQRKTKDLKFHTTYWVPWLKGQIMYHVILTVMNHPLIYTLMAQHNLNFGAPNTFWIRLADLARKHATWISRLIDKTTDRQIELTYPFFGYAAAVAATVHLYLLLQR